MNRARTPPIQDNADSSEEEGQIPATPSDAGHHHGQDVEDDNDEDVQEEDDDDDDEEDALDHGKPILTARPCRRDMPRSAHGQL